MTPPPTPMTEFRTLSTGKIMPPMPEENPARKKPWFVADVFSCADASRHQDKIRILMERQARAERQGPARWTTTPHFSRQIQSQRAITTNNARRIAANNRILAAMQGVMKGTEIAAAVGRDGSSVHARLLDLEQQGLVSRIRIPGERANFWRRTEAPDAGR